MRYLKKLAAMFVMIMAFAALTATVSAAEQPSGSTHVSSLADAEVSVKTAYYTGNGAVGPGKVTVKVDGKELTEGEDYKVTSHKHRAAGVYTLRIDGISSRFLGSKSVHWVLKDKSTKSSSVSYKNGTSAPVKVKKKSLKKDKLLTLKGSKGTSFKFKVTTPDKNSRKYIRTNKKTGRVRIKKGIKAGTYTVKITVYNSKGKIGTQTIKITIK